MDNLYTAGQYENNSSFFNVWNIPNLIPNDSVNLNNNFTDSFGEHNQSILNTQNETGQINLSYKQSSSPLFLDEVFNILDNFIKNQSENHNPQNFTVERSSENQILLSRYNPEFHNKHPQCKTMGLTPEESSNLSNYNFIQPISDSDSNECLSNYLHSPNQILNESVSNSYIPNSSISHFEKGISADYIRFEVDSPGIETKSRTTVFTNDSSSSNQKESVSKSYIPNSHFGKRVSADDIRIEVDSPEIEAKNQRTVFANYAFSPNQNDYVSKSYIPNSHFEKRISADDTIIEADSSRKKTKIRRTVFTSTQLKDLNAAFKRSHYLNPGTLEQLTQSLQLPENVVKVWFCNKRSNWKRKNKKLCNSNLNSIPSSLNDHRNNLAESPKNYEYDINLNQMENLVKSPKNFTYAPNLNLCENSQLDCTINSLSACIKNQNVTENGYSIDPVEVNEANSLYQSPNIYFEQIWI